APTAAGHSITAVKRAWRGRGIARALKAAEINWALDNGYTELHTSNEERNAPIERLNAHLGYRPKVERIPLVGPSLADRLMGPRPAPDPCPGRQAEPPLCPTHTDD